MYLTELVDEQKRTELAQNFVSTLSNRGTFLSAMGESDSALEELNTAIQRLEPLVGNGGSVKVEMLASCKGNRGSLRAELGNLAGAKEDYAEVISVLSRLVDEGRTELAPALGKWYFNRATLSADQGELRLAINDYANAIHHLGNKRNVLDIVWLAHYRWAKALELEKDFSRASDQYKNATSVLTSLLGQTEDLTLMSELARVHREHGEMHLIQRQLKPAVRELDAAISNFDAIHRRTGDGDTAIDLANCLTNRGTVRLNENNAAEAIPDFEYANQLLANAQPKK